jgi:hypothetical protein
MINISISLSPAGFITLLSFILAGLLSMTVTVSVWLIRDIKKINARKQ